jgi:hypothetical protein
MAGFYPLAPEESSDRVQNAGGTDIFLAQIIQYGKMQRLALPLV